MRPLDKGSLPDAVYGQLKNAITSGGLSPGQRLREREFAQALKVSQSTVREALILLQRDNLVVRLRNRGARVANFSDREIKERIAVRLVLESAAAIRAAKRVKSDQLQALEAKLASLNQTIVAGDAYHIGQADLEFHRCIWKLSGNDFLYRTLEQVVAPLFAFRAVIYAYQKIEPGDISGLHEPIVSAFQAGDREAIRRSIRKHILSPKTPGLW